MAPFLSVLRARDNGDASNSSVVWIAGAIIGGIIVLVTVVTTTILCHTKRRKFEKARQRNPYLTREEFMRRQKMSEEDLFREQEHWRGHMIKKSLATRSSRSLRGTHSRATSTSPAVVNMVHQPTSPVVIAMVDQIEREICELERNESKKLKEDWKQWEARVHRERSTSGVRHPIAASDSPDDVPLIAMPNPAKRRSRDRFSWSSIAPVPPPRHPARRLRASHG